MSNFLPKSAELAYYAIIAKIESGNNPMAKNSKSTASGLYQPIKSTWISFGFAWKDVFNVDKQNEFIRKFTAANAAVLNKSGCAVNFATLYGAHFLGASGLLQVMRGNPGDSITTVTSAAQRKANPTILNGTIGDFCAWLKKKTGDDVSRRYPGADEISVPVAVNQPAEVSPMNWFNGLVLSTILKYVLSIIGTVVVGKGYLDNAAWLQIVGLIMTALGPILGAKSAATEKVMLNGTTAKVATLTPATQASIAREIGAS